MNTFSLIISLIGIGFLIFIHELGHFLFCKLFNIPVPKFAIGMGPKILSKKYNGTEYSLRAVPVGGFVQIYDEKNESTNDVEVLSKKGWAAGIFVLFGGIIFNLLFAYLAIISISVLKKDSILKTNLCLFSPNIILSENNKEIHLEEKTLLDVIKNPSGFCIEGYSCNQNDTFSYIKSLPIKYDEPNTSFIKSCKIGVDIVNNIIRQTVYGIYSIIKEKKASCLSGPIGIIGEISRSFSKGFISFLAILSFISINLAIMNVLPIPIVDGGQFIFFAIAKLTRKKIPEKVENFIFYFSITLMTLLALLSTYNDILRIISQYKHLLPAI